MDGSYLPGYGVSTTRMVAARTAAERAALVPSKLIAGARVMDVGCGPGSITVGLAQQIGARGSLVALDVALDHLELARDALDTATPTCTVLRASVYALPVATASIDLVFAHALFEHLADPAAALAEIRRVVRPGGALALASSDWSGARVESDNIGAHRAIEGYRQVRRRTGADPDAGATLAGRVSAAGFVVSHHRAHLRRDMSGAELAHYIAERLAVPPTGTVPGRGEDGLSDDGLGDAREGAADWMNQPEPATVLQRWVEVLATTPSREDER